MGNICNFTQTSEQRWVFIPPLFLYGPSGGAALPPPLALPSLVALLEPSQPAAPQVLPGDQQAALVRHHAALPGGVVVRAQQQVLPPRLDLGALAGHVLCADPQQLVAAADTVLPLFVDRNDVDGELPPLAGLVSFQDVSLDGWRETTSRRFLHEHLKKRVSD